MGIPTLVIATFFLGTTFSIWYEQVFVYVPDEDRIQTIPKVDINTCLGICKQKYGCRAVGMTQEDYDNDINGPCYLINRVPGKTDKPKEGSEKNLAVVYDVRI